MLVLLVPMAIQQRKTRRRWGDAVVLRALARVFVCATVVACGGSQVPAQNASQASSLDLLVIAPHPDDEILMAAGAIAQTLHDHGSVHVAVMTNGDFNCQWSGAGREEETLRALAMLGVGAANVTFLGYPDGHLATLNDTPITVNTLTASGACSPRNHTYTRIGERPAPFTRPSVVEELERLLATLRPRKVITSNGRDSHPDHAATHALVLEALCASHSVTQLWTSYVHADRCYPASARQTETGAWVCDARTAAAWSTSPIPDPPAAFLDSARWQPLRLAYPTFAPDKGLLISQYTSQLNGDNDWLYAFARQDELYFIESVACVPSQPE